MPGTIYLLEVVVITCGILGSFILAPDSGEKITRGFLLFLQFALASTMLLLCGFGCQEVAKVSLPHHLQAMAVFVIATLGGVILLVDAIKKVSRR